MGWILLVSGLISPLNAFDLWSPLVWHTDDSVSDRTEMRKNTWGLSTWRWWRQWCSPAYWGEEMTFPGSDCASLWYCINRGEVAAKEDIKKTKSIKKDVASTLKIQSAQQSPPFPIIYLTFLHITSFLRSQKITEIAECDPREWFLELCLHQFLQILSLSISIFEIHAYGWDILTHGSETFSQLTFQALAFKKLMMYWHVSVGYLFTIYS